MDREEIKQALAPCGLQCKTCFAHVDGDIRKYSEKLKEKLGNFHLAAGRFGALLDEPVFKKYEQFLEVLDYFASKNCKGCRNEQCKLFKDCGVRSCHQKKQIDFCHECDEFPCTKTNFDPVMYKGWVSRNEMMMKKGAQQFYVETKDNPRYP